MPDDSPTATKVISSDQDPSGLLWSYMMSRVGGLLFLDARDKLLNSTTLVSVIYLISEFRVK